ncbi:DUF6612 family protein [Alteribacillus bidgolensis]|uniref:Outer membrane lipoprotein-sorting protein n=1 Tax=Alteribacillus bidgolensis TaxID=930129 RepID=A0A1G8E4T1_9BACI|nr:DUF6612 family protein [Alteribacillus bidgolensis]SDH64881.1 hypothetical protein SAMN05216352_10272 [Alteribacillus bidgolensis]
MAQIRKGLLLIMLTVFTSACMSEAETDENGNVTEPPEPEEPPEQEESIDSAEVLDNAIDSMEDLENYAIDTNMNQDIQFNKEGYLKNKYRSHTIVNLDPIGYHESSTIKTTEENGESDTSTDVVALERFFTEEGYYIFDSNDGRWVKFPDEFTEDIQSYDESFEKPAHTLELIEAYTDEIHISEGDQHYRLTFSGENEQLQQIALEMMRMVNTDFSEMMEDMMYMTEMEDLEFELLIDKETYYAKTLRMDMNMNMNSEEGKSYNSTHTVVARYSEFNEAKEVSIPDDVLDNAEEMELEEFSGFNEMEEFDTIEGIKIEEFYEDEDEENEEEDGEEIEIDLNEFLSNEDAEDES